VSHAAYEYEPEEDRSTTEGVKERAQEVVSQVQDTAETAKERTGDRLTHFVDERSTQGGEQALSMAESIRQSVQSMREQGQDAPARMAEQAADRVQALGLYLRDNDGNRILADVEDFARRQPLIVAAGAFVVGFAGARFLKASAARRQEQQPTTGPTFAEEYRPPQPSSPTTGADLGLGGPPGIGTAGTIDAEPPAPVNPTTQGATEFGAPADGATTPDTAPPTTATP
jgi:hypothetical protein